MKNKYFKDLLNKIRVSQDYFWPIILLASVMVLMFQGSRGLFEPDEGRYTNVALQILNRNEWISLYRNEWSLHFTKPPITYWAIATSLSIFGFNEWAVRLPMAIAFIATVALMFAFGRIYVPNRPWIPSLLYIISPVPYLAAYTVNTDTILCLFITLFFYSYVKATYSNKLIWLDVMWAALGLAFLTKGPPSLLALLVVMVHAKIYGDFSKLFRLPGIALFGLIGLLWYAIVIYRHPGLLDYFLGYEVIARIASDTHNRSPEWYGFLKVYIPVLLLASAPMIFLRPWRIPRESFELSGKESLLWVWLLLPFCVFSVSGSKLPLYVLWLVPALILLIARRFENFNFKSRHAYGLLAWITILLSVKYIADPALQNNGKDSSQYAEQLQKILPNSTKRLIFFGASPRYGLALYFPVSVSKVSLVPFTSRISDSPFDHTLVEEMSTKMSGGRVFLVGKDSTAQFIQSVRQSGSKEILLGRVGTRARYQYVYTLQSEFEK